MRWTPSRNAPAAVPCDLLIVACLQDGKTADLSPWRDLDRTAGGALAALKGSDVFTGAAESVHLTAGGGAKAGWILLLGLGKADDLTQEVLRRAVAVAVQRARGLKAAKLGLALPWKALGDLDPLAVARSCAEGGELALFQTGTHKTGKDAVSADPRSVAVTTDGADAAAVRDGLTQGVDLAAGCLFARALVNMPPNDLHPERMSAEARKLARQEGYTCQVHGEAWLREKKMGGILGVGQGSRRGSRLVVLERKPKVRGKVPTIALVGKGVTFDTGGISIKPSSNMHEMKGDMGGAAAVLGAALILARRNVKARLLVLVPTVENMPDGDAIRPGDVLRMASGKTLEVLNTDAEGRLILADALHHARTLKADAIIDAATLTGACVVALGEQFCGLFGNDGPLREALDRAGGEVFERAWPMPIVDEFHKMLESPIADLKNIGGGRWAGASTAAAFLEEFVDEDTPWAHLDIAGPSWTSSATPTTPAGPTGFGARLIARAVERYLEDRKDG